MKIELNDLLDMFSIVRIWIQLNIPKIEDGVVSDIFSHYLGVF